MAKIDFNVQPQRSDGRGYVPCELHRATSFAVIRVEHATRKGRKFTCSRVIERFSNKAEAEGAVDFHRKRHAPTPRHLIRKLGLRIVKP